jgi:hypothetical protein
MEMLSLKSTRTSESYVIFYLHLVKYTTTGYCFIRNLYMNIESHIHISHSVPKLFTYFIIFCVTEENSYANPEKSILCG